MGKPRFLFLFLGMLLLLSFASAFEFDNTLNYEPKPLDEITIKNCNIWVGTCLLDGSDLLKAKLNNNMCDENGRFCEATKTITLYDDEPLVQDFRTLRLDDGSNSEQNIRWWKIEYLGQIDDYEYQCSDTGETSINGTAIQECSNVKVGSHEGWIRYNLGDVLPAGTYEVKTSGEIRPGRVYDWQIKLLGEWTTPWAIWGNISLGAEAEVILNSPSNGATSYSANTLFNSSFVITGGATGVNMSYWNDDGGWSLKNSTVIPAGGGEITPGGTSGGSGTENGGVNFSVDSAIGGLSVAPMGGTNANRAALLNATGFELANATLVGGVYTITYNIVPNTDYMIVLDAGAGSYTYRFNNTNILPKEVGVFNIQNGVFNSVAYVNPEYVFNIINISAEGFTTSTQTWNYTIPAGDTIWNVQACDSDGDCGFATSNYTVSLDSTAPTVNILYPTGTIDSLTNGQNVSLNYSISDTNLDSCWYEYNGANVTTPCSLNSSFIYSSGVNTIKLWANDSVGNLGSDTSSWNVLFSPINQTYDTESFVTAFNNFEIYVTSPASTITSPKLIYNGNQYSATLDVINSSVFYLSSSVINNASVVGQNNPFYWNITLDGTEISSSTFYQNVSDINFTICDATNNVTYLSVFFEDELTSASLNSTIRTASFDYYVEDSSAAQSYTYSTSGNASQYDFCFDPGNTDINLDYSISYSGEGYPERTSANTLTLSNDTTNVTLKLLDDGNGLYATFQFIDSVTKIALSDVSVNIYDGVNLIISQTTDDSGLISEWLNPNILYEVQFSKSSYASGSESHRPVSTSTILIELVPTGFEVSPSITNGLTTLFYPLSTELDNGTSYSFGFYASEGEEEVETMTMKIYDEDRNLIYTGAQSGDGNLSQTSIDVKENKTIYVTYELNGTEGGYWSHYRIYYVTLINEDTYSLYWFGKSLNNYFPAAERTTITHLIWYVLWFISMMWGFTFGYNGAYQSKEDLARNQDLNSRNDLGMGMFFVFLVTSIFCMFNLIPFPYAYPAHWAWSGQISQWFLAAITLIATLAITKPSLFNIGRLTNR